MRIPVEEGNVFGGDLDEARAGLGQAPRQQAAEPEAAGVVAVEDWPGFAGQVEGIALAGVEQAMGVIDGTQHRLLMIIAGQVGGGAVPEKLPECALALGKAGRGHAWRRPDSCHRIGRIGQVERAVFAAEKAAGGKRFQFFRLANAFEPLADIDEGRHGGDEPRCGAATVCGGT